jgi:serine/threonine-protein kinase HipA
VTALDVFLHGDRVGKLKRLAQARLRFSYEPAWVERGGAPLSFCLPIRAEPFPDHECRPFFEGLLPEGEFLKAVARAFHVSADNPFAVLNEIGGECAGAVSLVPEGASPPAVAGPAARWLSEEELGELLDELPSRPLLAGEEDGIRLSLAGTRDKLPVLCKGDRIGITGGHPPSTHIIKTPVPRVRDTVTNEAYCMTLARLAGLAVADAGPRSAVGTEYLLVRRYDRDAEDGAVGRIHQEDLCQALGFVPAQKYASEGGPDVSACATFLREHSSVPAVDLLAFLDALLFNLLIGNHDAHSKNYSVLAEGEDAPRLAPLYDVLSTAAYGRRFSRKLAMKYGGENRPGYIRRRHLERLAADLDMAPGAVRDRCRGMVDRMTGSIADAREALPSPWRDKEIVDSIINVIDTNAKVLVAATQRRA